MKASAKISFYVLDEEPEIFTQIISLAGALIVTLIMVLFLIAGRAIHKQLELKKNDE